MKTVVSKSRASRDRSHYERLEARVPSALKSLFQQAADMRGVTLTDFIINSAHDVAMQTVEQHNLIRLNRQATSQFAGALLRPARSIPRLRTAASRYLKATGAR